jgi:AraC family transcriptional regulator
MMAVLEPMAGALKCVPHSTSYFDVDGAIFADGITADIRRYRWDDYCDSWFNPNVCFLSYELEPPPFRGSMQALGQRHYMSSGGTVFLPAGAQFVTRCVPGAFRLLCVTIDAERIMQMLGVELSDSDTCLDVRSRRVEQCMLRLVDEVREPGFASVPLVESVTLTLAVELFRHLRQREVQSAESGGKMAGWRLKRLKERIDADLGAALSVTELAQECGLSARHLIRTFKNTEGLTLSDYIARERMKRAKRRLGNGEVLVKEVAAECGFGSAASFSAAFRKATGKTPKEYRAERVRFG